MKKSWKRLGAMLLALVMVLSLVPATALARQDRGEVMVDAPDAAGDGALAAVDYVDSTDVDAVSAELMDGDEKPLYIPSNILAGLFDVGVTRTKNDDGTWTGTYSNPAHESETNGNEGETYPKGTVINATAPSYMKSSTGDGYPYLAVDGTNDTGDKWHSNWGGGAGYSGSDLKGTDNVDKCYIQLEIVAGPKALKGLRYRGNGGNGAITSYKIVTSSDGTTWSLSENVVAEGTWEDSTNWQYAEFANAVTTQYVRLYAVESYTNSQSGDKFINAREIRLVEDGTPPEVSTSISGTISDSNGNLDGATVQLVNSSYTVLESPAAVTTADNGSYTVSDVSSLEAGTYRIRVSKAGYGTKISPIIIDVIEGGAASGYENNNLALEAIDINSATYGWNFDSDDNKPSSSNLTYDSSKVTIDYPHDDASGNGAMKLTWASADRDNNLVTIANTAAKNCVVEFDATQGTDGSVPNTRFGLALRSHGNRTDGQYWIYIGQDNATSTWGVEAFKTTTETKSGGWSFADKAITFKAGETRHFKVTVADTSVIMTVDGVEVVNVPDITHITGRNDNHDNKGHEKVPDDELTTPGDVGILWGCETATSHSVTIDNLYVFRNDPSYQVTWTDPTGGTLSGVYEDNGNQTLGNGTSYVPYGSKVTISGTPTAEAGTDGLTAVRVVPTNAEANGTDPIPLTVNREQGGICTYSFTMPNYPVTVSGAFKPKLTGANISASTHASGAYRVGDTLTASAMVGENAADAATTTYEWYRVDKDHGTAGKVGSGSTYMIQSSDNGHTLYVVAIGGNNGAGWVQSDSTSAVEAAVVEVASVFFSHTAVTMWTNDSSKPTAGETQDEGATTVATVTVTGVGEDNPEATTPLTVEWESSNKEVASVAKLSDDEPLKATITAKKAGTATITCKVKACDSARTGDAEWTTDTLEITVKTKGESVTVKKDGEEVTEPVVVYANNEGNSVTLTGEVGPEGAEDKINWFRKDGKGFITTVERSEDGKTLKITATNSATEQKLGAVTWWASLGEDAENSTAPHKEFTVHVIRKLANPVSWTDATQAKVGGTLTVQTDQLKVYSNPDSTDADSGKNKLTYTWYKLDSATEELSSDKIIAAASDTGSQYKTLNLTADDYGKFIKVVVSAELDVANNFFYDGSVETTAVQVGKGDGPAAPQNLKGVNCETASNNDGKIQGLEAGKSYEVSKKGDGDTWGDYETKTADDQGYITGLDNGIYKVRIPESTYYKAGADSANVTILEFGANAKQINQYTSDEGSVTVDNAKVDPKTEVTITVEPATGYQLKKNTDPEVSYTDGEGRKQVLTLTPVQSPEDSSKPQYTFTMPDAEVTITAEFERLDLTITHDLGEGLSCNLTQQGETDVHTHTVKYGEEQVQIVISADDSHAVGEITVTKTGGSALGDNYFTLTQPTDLRTATITFPNGIKDNLTIKVASEARKYRVNADPLNNATITTPANADDRVATHGQAYTTVITASSGYEMPETITVKRGNDTLTAGTDYTYTRSNDFTTGTVVIKDTATTGALTIGVTAAKIRTSLTGVTIKVTHDITGTGENVAPHVGDSLQAIPAAGQAENVTATYQWYRDSVSDTNKIANATSQTYTLVTDDLGKQILVVATGSNDFKDSVTSTATLAVLAKIVKVTGVTVAPGQATIYEQGTVELTATIAPANATNKKVTWSSGNTSVATVDAETGVVTGVAAGEATITATAEDGGFTSTCAVTVEAKPEVGVTLNAVSQVGQTLTATVYPEGTTPANGYVWTRIKGETETTLTGNGASYTLTAADVGATIKVTVTINETAYSATSEEITTPPVDKAALQDKIDEAKEAKDGVETSDKAASEVLEGTKFVPTAKMDALEAAIETAEAALDTVASEADVTAAVKALDNVLKSFKSAIKIGTMKEKFAITIAAMTNGTVTANKEAAAEGETVTLTVAPDGGYKLTAGTLAVVTTEDSESVTVTDNKFVMPAKAVTVSAAFEMLPADEALTAAITAAENAMKGVAEKPEGTDPTTVANGTKFTTAEAIQALKDAIDAAKEVKDTEGVTDEQLTTAVGTLNDAVDAFKEAVQTGTKKSTSSSSGSSSGSTKVETKEDGTKVTTVTNPDGSKTVVTESPDGTKETVDTKRDGTVVATTETPDGAKEVVETKKDGTVTETVTDPEGAKTETVTSPEGDKAITVTDKDGEELVKVELPAEITVPAEEKFDDTDAMPWAKESINKVAALELVKGTSEGKYTPAAPMTRGALATVLHRLSQGKTDYNVTFKDVAAGKYYTDGVAWAAKAGVVKGITADLFAPEQTITREQLAVMMARYAKLIGLDTTADASVLDAYADADQTGNWAVGGVAWCVKAGILQGRGEGVLDPTTGITRAEVAVMLDRFIAVIMK